MRFLNALLGTLVFIAGLVALGVLQGELISNITGRPSGTPIFLVYFAMLFGFGLMAAVIIALFCAIYNSEKN